MRRILFVAALSLSLAGLSACTPTENSTGAPATAASSAAPSPTVATADKKTVCAAVQALSFESSAKIMQGMTAAIGAIMDPSKEEAAIKGLKEPIANLQAGLDKEAARTTDADLKAAIATFGAEVRKAKEGMEAAGNDLEKVMDAVDQEAISAAEQKVISICE